MVRQIGAEYENTMLVAPISVSFALSIVSKAAGRSRRIKTVTCPLAVVTWSKRVPCHHLLAHCKKLLKLGAALPWAFVHVLRASSECTLLHYAFLRILGFALSDLCVYFHRTLIQGKQEHATCRYHETVL